MAGLLGRVRLLVVMGVMGVIVAGLMPAAAAAQAGTVRDIGDFACPGALTPSGGYVDVVGNPHEDAIDCLSWYGIAHGTGARVYDPAANVTRGQMAAFVVRLVEHVNGDLLPGYDHNRFTDLTAAHPFATEINRLAAAGVVAGGPAGRPPSEYGPGLPVSRAQMASFLTRVHRLLTDTRLDTGADCFTDDQGNAHEQNINALCAAGVVVGRAFGTYAPNDAVRRDAMASFVMRLSDLLVEAQHTTPPGMSVLSVDNASLTAGDRLSGTIIGGGISRVTATGCGLPSGSEISRGIGGRFSLAIPLGQTDAACTVSFRVLFADGATRTHEQALTFESLTIASLTVSPTSDSVATHSTAGGADANRGRRTLTVTGRLADGRPAAGGSVDLRLVDADSLAVGSGGSVRFLAGSDGKATLPAAVNALIETIDGTAQAGTTRRIDGLRLGEDGTVTVAIDAVGSDAVRLVAFTDPDNDQAIKVEASGAPSSGELVAVSGRTTMLPPPASSFTTAESGLVTFVDKAGSQIGVARGAANGSSASVSRTDRLYTYDSNDQFRVGGATVSRSTFVAALSRADVVRVGPYSATSGGVSVLDIVTDNPQPPAIAAKAQSNPGTVTVTVTGTNPQQLAVYSKLVIQRAVVTGGTAGQSNGTVGSWTTVGEPTADADVFTTGFQFVQSNVPNGMYRYRAAGVVDGQQSGYSPSTTNIAVGSVGPTPLSLSLAVTVDNGPAGSGGANGILDQGDRLTATFDQAMTLVPGWEIRLLDRDGTVGRLNNARATGTVGGTGNRQVTFTLTAAPQIQQDGTTPTMNLSAAADNYLQVLSVSGITGTGGAWNLPASGVPGASPTRTFVGANARHPAAPTEVSTDPGIGTVTIGAGSNVQAGEPVFVSNERGEQIGQATKGAGATTITTSPKIGPGQVVYVVYRDTVGGPNAEAFSQSLKVTTQNVRVTGISPSSGTKAGGTTVTISGSGFSGTTVKAGAGCTVFIGGVCVASVANITATSFQAVTPSNNTIGTPLVVEVFGVTSSSVRFTYTNSAPTVAVTGEPGAVASGETATYSGTASDPDGALNRVEVQVKQGATIIAAWATTPTGPTPWSWTSDPLAAGSYTFEFRAVDDLGVTSPVVTRTLVVT